MSTRCISLQQRARSEQKSRRVQGVDIDDLDGGVEPRHRSREARDLVGVGPVALGNDQAVGDRDLLAAFRVALELSGTVHRIDCRYHGAVVEPVAQHRITGEREQERRREREPREAVDVTATRTGRAFVVSGLTAIAGVAVIATSSQPLLRGFGLVVGLNVAVALLSALVVLPPLLVWADQWGLVARGMVPRDVLVRTTPRLRDRGGDRCSEVAVLSDLLHAEDTRRWAVGIPPLTVHSVRTELLRGADLVTYAIREPDHPLAGEPVPPCVSWMPASTWSAASP